MKRPCSSGATSANPGEGGFVTIEYVLAVTLSMVVLVAIANFVVFQYGHGVVRAALDQGVREGARSLTPKATCEASAQQVIDDLLGGRRGSMGGGVAISCTPLGGHLDATARTRFRAWLRPLPDWSFSTTATARLEASR